MTSSQKYDLIIVGGGLAGIALAIRRRIKGEQVLILEKNKTLGGKLASYQWEDYRWDRGPSLFTLPEQIDELFEICGKKAEDHFEYEEVDESCRYFYSDGTNFKMHKDKSRRQRELASSFDSLTIQQFENYLRNSKKQYDRLATLFIDRKKIGFKDLLSKELIKETPDLFKKQLRQSLHQYNDASVKEPKLVQLLDRFATYNGSDPYQMSGIYSNIASLETSAGTFFPKKGMRSIVDSLVALADDIGVDILTDQNLIELQQVEEGYRVVSNHQEFETWNLSSAIDHINFYKLFLKDEKLANKYSRQERSASALIFYWALDKKFDQIGLHNIFFSRDYEKEFKQLFKLKQLPSSPTIYVHNSSSICQEDAPKDGQNWFTMLIMPAGIQPTEDQIEILKRSVLQRLKIEHMLDIEPHIVHETIWTKNSIEEITGAYQGALYGASSNSKLAPFKRHPNKSSKYKNLYFCGGTVHPGGGIPLVLKSAKIVDQLMDE